MTRDESNRPTRAEIARAFDEIAHEFDATRTRPWPETFAFAAELPPGAHVLDLGCGNGRNIVALAERGRVVVGLDAAVGLLVTAADKVGTGVLVRGDAVALPFRGAAFDAIHCVATIHHLPTEADRRRTIAEAGRVLRPGGLLLVSVWALEQNRFRGVADADITVPWHRADGHSVPRFYHLFRAGELERLVAGAGFAIVRAWREGDNYAILAARR